MPGAPIPNEQITGVVLAGGRGSRMDGVDKGLQLFNGVPLALHALRRLRPQVGQMMAIANRNLADYRRFDVPVWPDDDALPGFAGPLAGFLAGLSHCATPWLLTAPCDTPCFPSDLATRMAEAFMGGAAAGARIAMATDGHHPQPVFCLLHHSLREDLRDFLRQGGRKVGAWAARHDAVRVPFGRPEDFANINSRDELRALEAGAALGIG
ncbi:MAG: molybdenum cofactor guanylyltransferase [Variovorax sp.]|nr:molybdenum cofactor guanylyltransferase [Variovorax sp.]